MVFDTGRPIAQVAHDLDVNRESLRLWVKRAQADATPPAGRLLPSDVERELAQLRKENAELRRANAILREASVLFAKELDPLRRS